MTNNLKYAVFISSSDAYSDLWPIFFHLFKKFWPSFDGVIYLNTEEMDFEYEGLDIVCTKVGRLGSFGKVFQSGLDCVELENVLLVMIDYFFMGNVEEAALVEYLDFFLSTDIDSLCFVRNPYERTTPTGVLDLDFVVPPSRDMFSYQIAFWKKNVLRQMALSHETPWLSEWYGTARANQMKLRLVFPRECTVFPYLAEGALHKGKWVKRMVNFLEEIQYPVDFAKRGHFVERETTIYERAYGRCKTSWPRFLSHFDLLKRRLQQ